MPRRSSRLARNFAATTSRFTLPVAPTVWAILAPCIVLCAAPLGAQWRADLGMGGARVTQSQVPATMAAVAHADVAYEAHNTGMLGAAGVTAASRGDVRLNGLLAGIATTSPLRRTGVELSAMVSAYDDGNFDRQVSGVLGARVRVDAGRMTLWGGASRGALNDGAFSYPLTTIEAGAVAPWRTTRFALSVVRTSSLGEPRTEFVDDPPVAVVVRDRLAYTDATVGVHSRWGRAELNARARGRVVHQTIAFEERPPLRLTAGLDAAWWGTRRTAIVLGAGHDLADLARGLPESRFVSLGLKVRLRDPARRMPAPRIFQPPRVARPAAEILVEQGAAHGATLRVLAPWGTRLVEVAGTFTDWAPVTLTADGAGSWLYENGVASGPHRLMIRVDGGEWQPPANLPSVDDEFGSRVGLVTVP